MPRWEGLATKALKGPLPQVSLVPAGGVNLETAASFIRAGAAALGIGGELVVKEALQLRTREVTEDLSRKYIEIGEKDAGRMHAKESGLRRREAREHESGRT